MVNIVLFILISLGATNIVVRESIFKGFRNIVGKWFPYSLLNKMINCETCLSFWVGAFLSVLMAPNFLPIFCSSFILNAFFWGCISSISNKIILIILYKF